MRIRLSLGRRSDEQLPPFEVEQGPWPCEDPGCVACQLTPDQWREVMRLVFEERKDPYIVLKCGCLVPLELRHVTVGENGLTDMLRRVKRDARRAAREGRTEHSHTTVMRWR